MAPPASQNELGPEGFDRILWKLKSLRVGNIPRGPTVDISWQLTNVVFSGQPQVIDPPNRKSSWCLPPVRQRVCVRMCVRVGGCVCVHWW